MESPDSFLLEITPDASGLRLDRALARSLRTAADGTPDLPRLSRSRLRRLLAEGAVATESGRTPAPPPDPTRIAQAGERYRIAPPPTPPHLAPEPLPLEILFEDAHLLVINKPPGMLVHPAHAGHTGTLAHAILAHCGDSLAAVGHPLRPGIVHRLDMGTGGLLVVARTEATRLALAERFAAHDVDREYLAIARGVPARAHPALAARPGVSFRRGGWIRIEAPLGTDPGQPTRRAVVARGGKRAVTHLRPEQHCPTAPPVSLLRCRLDTGRTHQIRVHLAWIGHPLIGDRTYGRAPSWSATAGAAELRARLALFARPALHACRLGFDHPATGSRLCFEVAPHADFRNLAGALGFDLETPPATDPALP